MSKRLVPLALALLAPLAAFAQGIAYTELDGPQCRPVRGDQGTTECPGPAGLGFRVNRDHVADIVTLRIGRGEPLQATPDETGPGSVTGRVEWHLAEGRPYAFILRRRIQDESFRVVASRLEAYRIGQASICFLGQVRGAEENLRARQLVEASRNRPCP